MDDKEDIDKLLIVVQNVDLDSIQMFMKSAVKVVADGKTKIVFLYDERKIDQKQRQALAYANGFAKAIGCLEHIQQTTNYAVLKNDNAYMLLDCNIELTQSRVELFRAAVKNRKAKARQSIEDKDVEQEQSKTIVACSPVIEAGCQEVNNKKIEEAIQNDIVVQKEEKVEDIDSTKDVKPIEKVFFKIIIPNYNNMAYIKKCLDSILEQTFQDFKIIIVDDLSTDGSDKFCEAYARKFNQKIIFKQSSKKLYAGGCRNVGIDFAIESKYMMFIDSDDWLYEKHTLQKIHDISIKSLPKMIRAPMLHYFGEDSKNNFKDRFTSVGKKYMFMVGPGPGRTIVRSDICQHFIEDRSKCNDVIWFLRCIDRAPLASDVVNMKEIWYVYNRISTTSCQNNINTMISKKCVDDQLSLADDLKNEKFATQACRELAQYKINATQKLYKQHISVAECMKNAFFISIDKKRANAFTTLFNAYGFSPLPKAFYGCVDAKIHIKQRCKQSHINVVKHAKKHNLPYVFIFEDDAYPCIDAVDVFERYLYAMPYDANLILFGWCNCTKNGIQTFAKPFNRIKTPTISGAHAYMLFKSGYDQYLQFFETNKNAYADNDVFYAISNSYIVNYPIFIQYSSSASMNNHIGYIFYGDHPTPPKKFKPLLKEEKK